MNRRGFFRGLLGLVLAPVAALGLGGSKRETRIRVAGKLRIPDLSYPNGSEAATCNYPGEPVMVPIPVDGAHYWVRRESGQLEFAIPKEGDVFFSHDRFWRLKRAFIAKGNIRTDEHLEIAAAQGHVEPVDVQPIEIKARPSEIEAIGVDIGFPHGWIRE